MKKFIVFGLIIAAAWIVLGATVPTTGVKTSDLFRTNSLSRTDLIMATIPGKSNVVLTVPDFAANILSNVANISFTNANAATNGVFTTTEHRGTAQTGQLEDIYVTGSSDANVNGHYVHLTPNPTGLVIWTNIVSNFGLVHDLLGTWEVFDRYEITNLASVHVYGGSGIWLDGVSLAVRSTDWEVVDGVGTAPTFVTYATNFTTNIVISLETSGMVLNGTATDTNIYVDAIYGNDYTASIGNPKLAYSSLNVALSVAKPWQKVLVNDGEYWETNTVNIFSPTLPVGVQIIGNGPKRTRIYGIQNTSTFTLSNSNVIANLYSSNMWYYPGLGTAPGSVATNTFLINVEADASGDVWFGVAFWDAYIINCTLGGNSDKIADAMDNVPPEFANSHIYIINTVITGGEGSDGYGLRHAAAQQVYHNLSIHTTTHTGDRFNRLYTDGLVLNPNRNNATMTDPDKSSVSFFATTGVPYAIQTDSGGVSITNRIGLRICATMSTNVVLPSTTFSNMNFNDSIYLLNGHKYTFEASFYVSDSVAGEGAKIDFNGGGVTITDFRVHTLAFDTALQLSSQGTALATVYNVATFTGSGVFTCTGSIEPSSTGLFKPRFAQNSHSTGSITLQRGSHIIVTEEQ